jgi:hypothetical protein
LASESGQTPLQYLPICTALISTSARIYAALRDTMESYKLPTDKFVLGEPAHFDVQCYVLNRLYYLALVAKKSDAPELMQFCASCVAAELIKKWPQIDAWGLIQNRIGFFGAAFTDAQGYKQGVESLIRGFARLLQETGLSDIPEVYLEEAGVFVVRDPLREYLIINALRGAQCSYIREFDCALAGVMVLPGDVRLMPFEDVVSGLRFGLEKYASEEGQKSEGV